MELEYSDEKVKLQCTSVKAARKLFGGDEALTVKLMSRISALTAAETIKDIISQSSFRFHSLHNKGRKKYQDLFSIDVKSPKEAWRIILRPLDQDKKPYEPCNIDEIANKVTIVEIMEVSKHYE